MAVIHWRRLRLGRTAKDEEGGSRPGRPPSTRELTARQPLERVDVWASSRSSGSTSGHRPARAGPRVGVVPLERVGVCAPSRSLNNSKNQNIPNIQKIKKLKSRGLRFWRPGVGRHLPRRGRTARSAFLLTHPSSVAHGQVGCLAATSLVRRPPCSPSPSLLSSLGSHPLVLKSIDSLKNSF